MPVFFRPVHFHRALPRVYASMKQPQIYKCLRIGLDSTENRDCPSLRKSRVHFKTLKDLQGDYARYAKKLAKYAYERYDSASI